MEMDLIVKRRNGSITDTIRKSLDWIRSEESLLKGLEASIKSRRIDQNMVNISELGHYLKHNKYSNRLITVREGTLIFEVTLVSFQKQKTQ